MDFNEFVENGKVKYDDFERNYLLGTHPSYFGGKPSDLENLLDMRGILATFDFTLVKPDINLVQFLEKKNKKWEVLDFVKGDFEDAYKIKAFIQNQFNVVGDRVFSDSQVKYVRNQNDESMQGNQEFLIAKSKILKIFPNNSKIFLYGSGMKKDGRQNDFDFRVIIPKIDLKSYMDYMNYANILKDEKMPITFGVLPENNFKNFQLSDNYNIFYENNSILVQGEIPIYESKNKGKLGLIQAGHKLLKTRESLIDKSYFSAASKVKARRNEPYFVNEIFISMFGDKNLKFEKFSEKNFYPLEIKYALIKANENLRLVFDAYSNEILESFY